MWVASSWIMPNKPANPICISCHGNHVTYARKHGGEHVQHISQHSKLFPKLTKSTLEVSFPKKEDRTLCPNNKKFLQNKTICHRQTATRAQPITLKAIDKQNTVKHSNFVRIISQLRNLQSEQCSPSFRHSLSPVFKPLAVSPPPSTSVVEKNEKKRSARNSNVTLPDIAKSNSLKHPYNLHETVHSSRSFPTVVVLPPWQRKICGRTFHNKTTFILAKNSCVTKIAFWPDDTVASLKDLKWRICLIKWFLISTMSVLTSGFKAPESTLLQDPLVISAILQHRSFFQFLLL